MKSDESTPFEDRLARMPMTGLPPDLRAACLAEVRGSANLANSPLWAGLRQWFWPHPAAWAGLAALWCLILGLHWQAPVPVDVFASSGPSTPLMPDPDVLQQLALQRQTRNEALRPSAPSLPFDLDRPRNSQPQTNRIA